MTRSCCLQCRLRFASEAVPGRSTCPFCAGALTPGSSREALGLRLVAPHWAAADDRAVARALESARREWP